MHLILWRHAEAEDHHPRGDAERQLTPRGEEQARRMAKWLQEHLPKGSRILASPARRTRQTAEALACDYTIDQRLFFASNVEEHVHAIQEHTQSGAPALVLVGHQPLLGQLAAGLLCGQSQPWSVRKGNVWWLQHRQREEDQVILRAVLDPEWL